MHRNSKVVLILSFCLITTAVLAAGRCVPCKLNHYCVDGLRYQCPSTAPVTQGTGAGALNECLTCTQRNGNSANPIYDDLVGDCVSCYEYDSSTPIWDGNACVACASGTAFNGETGLCESSCPTNTVANEAGVCVLSKAINECESGYIAISTAEQLAKIGVDANYPLDGSYCLLNDISLAAYGENYNNGEGWTPIGNINNEFTGIFDGNSNEISDLYINRPEADYQGLFGVVSGSSSQIRNISVNVEIIGALSGGLVASINSGTIKKCNVSGNVTGTGIDLFDSTGGLVASNSGVITNSFSTANVSGYYNVGGLAGVSSGTISNSYSKNSTVTAQYQYAGGLVGMLSGTVSNSYSHSNVYGVATGGLVGKMDGQKIMNSYSIGKTADGGFIGVASSYYSYSLIGCYFDMEASGVTKKCGQDADDRCDNIANKTTAEMQTPQTFIDAGWDTSIWELVQGQYPKLKGVGGQ